MLKARLFAFLALAFVVSSGCLPATAHAERKCLQHWRKSRLLSAAKCYLALAEKLAPRGKTLSRLQRALKKNYLRVASKAYLRLAKRNPRVERKAWYYEKAAELLERFPKEDLCTPTGCATIRMEAQHLRRKIGLARLTIVVTLRASLSTEVRGFQFRFQKRIRGALTLTLRPGPYLIVVSSPNGSAHRCRVYMQPNERSKKRCFRRSLLPEPARVVRRPAPPRRLVPKPKPRVVLQKPSPPPSSSSTVLGWALTGVGGALMVGGGIAIALGQGDFALFQKGKTSRKSASSLLSFHQAGVTKTVVGGVGLGLGGATLVAGVAVLLLNRKTPSPPATGTSSTRKHRSTLILTR